MARYCSAQDNVRTRQSPPYRETIRVNVLHGRKSMSWAKSVLPLFTGASSETFRKVPDRVQIDTTLNRQNRVQNHPFIGRHRLLNRTAVMRESYRILRTNGIMFLTFFCIEHVELGRRWTFRHRRGSGYIESTRYPEAAVAYHEAFVIDLAKKCGFRE